MFRRQALYAKGSGSQPTIAISSENKTKICQFNNIQSPEGRSRANSQCILTTPQAKGIVQQNCNVMDQQLSQTFKRTIFFLYSCI
jgi:hypothetical protein